MAEQQQLQPGQTEEPAETGFFDRLFSGDKPLWIIVISLAIISLLVVYSSTASMAYKNAGGNTAHYFFNQLKFIAIGFVIMWFVHRINYQRYVRFTVVLFILALGFMLLTFVIGVNLNSASRWIRIPIIGMTFQPSDFMRVTLVALLAQQLAKRQKVIDKIPILPALTPGGWRKNPRKNRDILFDTTIPLLGPVVVACGAIFFSNFSTAALTFFTCWVMLFIGRVRVRELWRLIALVVVVMAWIMVLITNQQGGISGITPKSWLFLCLSGLATGASWLCYYKAIQIGEVSKVVPIDKLSVVITLILAFVFLHERFTWKSAVGAALITAGTLVMVL